MTNTPTADPPSLISATAYARIFATSGLAQRLLPEGLSESPYAVMGFDATLTLHDSRGMRATFGRTQRVRFCQDGVSVIIAERAFGPKARFAYQAFTYLNQTYFAQQLPWPLILWGLTAHGACLARVQLQTQTPIIHLHPSLLGGRGDTNPWGKPADDLGPAFAMDTLLHECLHLAVQLLHGGASGPTSHNSPEWVTEVNRLAPLLGLTGYMAGRRVRLPDPHTPPGSRRTKVQRVSEATLNGEPVAFSTVTGFPHTLRRLLQPTTTATVYCRARMH